MTRAIIATLGALVLATGAAASTGDNGRQQIRLNAADNAAARAIVLRQSDFANVRGWSGDWLSATPVSTRSEFCGWKFAHVARPKYGSHASSCRASASSLPARHSPEATATLRCREWSSCR
jgi:hypothetical protein